MRDGKLSDLVAEIIERRRVTVAEVAQARERYPKVQWPGVPVLTQARLLGEPLQAHLVPRLSLGLEEFVDIYEEYVSGFVFSRALGGNPQRWLQKKLKLGPQQARALFFRPPGRGHYKSSQLHRLFLLVAVSALAAVSYDGVWAAESDSLLVQVGDFQFGVRPRGAPYTHYPNQGVEAPAVKGFSCPLGLHNYGRQPCGKWVDSSETLYAGLLAWSRVFGARLGEDLEGFRIAITFLNWECRREPARLRNAMLEGASEHMISKAVYLASGFDRAPDPYATLQRHLVPVVLTPRMFKERFGHRPPTTKAYRARAARWQEQLSLLEPKTTGIFTQ